MTLNLLASVVIFCGAVALFAVYAFSDPKKFAFINLPPFVRLGFGGAGALALVYSLSFTGMLGPGSQLDAFGVLTFASITYALSALAIWVVLSGLKGHGMDRARFVVAEQRRDPSLVPVMMKAEEVTQTARAVGIAAVPPNAPPEALIEATRSAVLH